MDRKLITPNRKPWGEDGLKLPPPPPKIGELDKEGNIAFADWTEPSTGSVYRLLAAPATKRIIAMWGLYNRDTGLPNITSASTQDPNCGSYNTDVLMSEDNINFDDGRGSIGSPTAKHCRSLGSEYFLPNHDQLNLIYTNRLLIDNSDASGGAAKLSAISSTASCPVAGTSSNWCWSSTENSAHYVWIQYFGSGYRGSDYKNYRGWVLPIRRIAISP